MPKIISPLYPALLPSYLRYIYRPYMPCSFRATLDILLEILQELLCLLLGARRLLSHCELLMGLRLFSPDGTLGLGWVGESGERCASQTRGLLVVPIMV